MWPWRPSKPAGDRQRLFTDSGKRWRLRNQSQGATALLFESLESRTVLTAAFDLIGLTALRSNPTYAAIDGMLPTNEKIGVAILDTGIFAKHPDLQGNFVAYYDAVQGIDGAPWDPQGHGTHVSGTVASTNTAYGVAVKAGLISVRVLSSQGESFSGDPVLRGLNWVIDNRDRYNIQIVNMSLEASPRLLVAQAVGRLQSVGVTIVSAAGNFYADAPGSTQVAFPATNSTLSVGSVWAESGQSLPPGGSGRYQTAENNSSLDQISAFSQRGTDLNQIMAPGARILSTSSRDGAVDGSGTSMAAPMVSGAVALLQDAAVTYVGRWLLPAEVQTILRNTADVITDRNIPYPSNYRIDSWTGLLSDLPETGLQFRRLNIFRAVEYVRSLAPAASDDFSQLSTAISVPSLNGTQSHIDYGTIGLDGTRSVGANDVDIYKVTIDAPGTLTVIVSQPAGAQAFNPYLRVFDSSGTELVAVDDLSFPVTQYPAVRSPVLQRGTYYFAVSSSGNGRYNPVSGTGRSGGSSQGRYKFEVWLENPDANGTILGSLPFSAWGNRTFSGGQNIAMDFSHAIGEIGSDPPPDDSAERVQLGGGDVDMFEVIVPDSGTMLVGVGSYRRYDDLANPAPFDTLVRVFDASGNEIGRNDDAVGTLDSFVNVSAFRNERLYIAVSDARNANYDPQDPFHATMAGGGFYDLAVYFDTKDVDGVAFSATNATANGASYTGVVGYDNRGLVGADGTHDVDFYSYIMPVEGVFDVSVVSPDGSLLPSLTFWELNSTSGVYERLAESGGTSGRHQIYRAAGTKILVSVTGVGNESYSYAHLSSRAGGDTGNYLLFASVRPVSDWWNLADDSSSSSAVATLRPGTWARGELGRDEYLFRGRTDVDLFRFAASTTGRIRVTAVPGLGSGLDSVLRIFDSVGREIAFNDDASQTERGSSAVLSVLAGQTYFVGVSGYGDGNLRQYTTNGNLSTVEGSTGEYWTLIEELPAPVPPIATLETVQSPRQSAVPSISISFTTTVTGVDVGDFRLTRDGQSVSLSGASVQGSGNQYTLIGLSGVTAAPGTYSLTLAAGGSGVSSADGGILATDALVSWSVTPTNRLSATIGVPQPSQRTTAIPSISIAFSAAVRGFDWRDLSLTRNGVPVSLARARLVGVGASWTLTGLGLLTRTPGAYSLSIRTNSGIIDAIGAALSPVQSAQWQVLPTASFSIVPATVRTAVRSVGISFSAPVTGVSVASFSLSVDGTNESLAGASVRRAGAAYVFYLPSRLLGRKGQFVLTLDGNKAGITSGGLPIGNSPTRSWRRI